MMGLDKKIEKELKAARTNAIKGNAVVMDKHLESAVVMGKHLNSAQIHALEARLGVSYISYISGKVTETRKIGYKVGYAKTVPLEIGYAKECAEEGNVIGMEDHLRTAQRHAREAGLDISEQVTGIGKGGYGRAVPLELAAARKYAEKGNEMSMEGCLKFAKKYAKKAGRDISKEVTEITKALVPKNRPYLSFPKLARNQDSP